MARGEPSSDRALRLGRGLGWTCRRAAARLSRFATADGAEDRELPAAAAWAVPATKALSPLLGWGDADLTYLTYGKIWFPLFLAFTLCRS